MCLWLMRALVLVHVLKESRGSLFPPLSSNFYSFIVHQLQAAYGQDSLKATDRFVSYPLIHNEFFSFLVLDLSEPQIIGVSGNYKVVVSVLAFLSSGGGSVYMVVTSILHKSRTEEEIRKNERRRWERRASRNFISLRLKVTRNERLEREEEGESPRKKKDPFTCHVQRFLVPFLVHLFHRFPFSSLPRHLYETDLPFLSSSSIYRPFALSRSIFTWIVVDVLNQIRFFSTSFSLIKDPIHVSVERRNRTWNNSHTMTRDGDTCESGERGKKGGKEGERRKGRGSALLVSFLDWIGSWTFFKDFKSRF